MKPYVTTVLIWAEGDKAEAMPIPILSWSEDPAAAIANAQRVILTELVSQSPDLLNRPITFTPIELAPETIGEFFANAYKHNPKALGYGRGKDRPPPRTPSA